GAVWVFTRSGSTWTQQAKLTGSGEVNLPHPYSMGGEFGSSVALSGDGSTALIGGPGDNEGVGAAWVFTRTGSTWTQQGPKLTVEHRNIRLFGDSVALSSDGSTALISAREVCDIHPGGCGNYGAVWAFTRSGSTWTQQGEIPRPN